MSHSFVVYIDEAGDDGIGKFRGIGQSGQTHWLVLSACIVSAENDRLAPAWRDEILFTLGKSKKRDLHFVDLDHNQAVAACRVLARKPVGAISVLSDKKTLVGIPQAETFKKKNHLYKYMLRYLMERVSTACERRAKRETAGNGKAKIVFSRRGGMDYDDFKAYMSRLKALQLARGAMHRIAWDHIDIETSVALDHSRYAGLQLVDLVASAFHRAVEPNLYGFYEDRYARELAPIVMKDHAGHCFEYGVKCMSKLEATALDEAQQAFFKLWKWQGQAPGPCATAFAAAIRRMTRD